ncbi:MAG: endopeptidase La [Phycisphaerae bacterium]|nr:endopeptidase La [Phycisphaerae bacterium]
MQHHTPSARSDEVPRELAVLPVRDTVLFPGSVIPLSIERDRSRRLLSDVLPKQKVIAVVCQKDADVEEPGADDCYQVATAVTVLKLLRLEDDRRGAIVHGLSRVRIDRWIAEQPHLQAEVTPLTSEAAEDKRTEALEQTARRLARRALDLMPNVPDEAGVVLDNIEGASALADFLAANLPIEAADKQKLLETIGVNTRLRSVVEELQRQLEVLELSNKIQAQVKERIDQSQREYYLQEQLKAIQEELGQTDEKTAEMEELRQRLNEAGLPDGPRATADRELKRLGDIPTASPEHNMIRTYLEWLADLPWNNATADKLDIARARKVLNEDHHDLNKVKRRILEYLSVRKLAPHSRGPILCFVGPPGVGKTSLGQSIARALGRNFIRMSLGGMRDEAELRGHRRTYIGAMPGRIVQEVHKAGTNNPVFMLDELDKVGKDFRGDPASALLEVLDPAQNDTFQDHYLNVPFDLSNVMFIGTANVMTTVPPALRDRIEVIELPGYTEQDKLRIATGYLVPRQLDENGLTASQAKWKDAAVQYVIARYTREAGVRELERQIGTVCRGIAAMIAEGKAKTRTVNRKLVRELLGPEKYESDVALRTSTPGVATGLAYTPTGGEIIFIEAAMYPGKGELTLTGQIGDVMRESVQAAFSLVRSRADALGIDAAGLGKKDVHVHVPAGAVSKDGPSAGVAMVTALTSLLTGKSVRPEVAMTGEITLRGLVLPVGGIKEKALAARRAGICSVVLPDRNRKDLEDIPPQARRELRFKFVRKIDDVLEVALDGSAGRGSRRRSQGT